MNFTLFWRIIASVMSGKYSQSASWTREIWALAVFVAGFTLHDWQSQGSERLLALMMMLGSGAFMCFALVERLFFLPRIHQKENDANSPELMEIGRMARNEGVNYDGPRTSPIVSSGGDFAGPDGLDPIPSPVQPPHYPYLAEKEAESPPPPPDEDDPALHADLHSALSDPFFDGDKK